MGGVLILASDQPSASKKFRWIMSLSCPTGKLPRSEEFTALCPNCVLVQMTPHIISH